MENLEEITLMKVSDGDLEEYGSWIIKLYPQFKKDIYNLN
jgi:hypothetical protein